MKKIIFLLLLSSNVIAQSIVNTELKSADDNRKYFAEIEGMFEIQKGNTELFEMESSVILGYNVNSKHLVKFLFGNTHLSEDSESIENDSYAQIRHNFKFSRDIKSFAFIQYQKNLNLLLMERLISGGGIRYDTKQTYFDFGIGSGFMYENEVLFDDDLLQSEENNTTTIRMAGLSTISFSINAIISVHNTTYLQPSFSNFFSDFRLLNELSILIELGEVVSLENQFTFRHDSDPPSVLKEDDFAFMSGIVISF